MSKIFKNKLIMTILIVLIIILIGAGFLYKYFVVDTKHMERVFNKKNISTKANKVGKAKYPEYPFDNNGVNFLIVGLDKASNRTNYDLHRTDTILFVNINFKDKKVRGISIPRDTLTEIYNVDKWDKINSAFGYGGGAQKDGFFYATETVSKLLGGMPIFYYVGFDLDAIRKVVNILGGVYVNVEVPVKVKTQWIDIDLKPGYQKLNGIETLYYALWRKTPGGDIDRIKRDKELILTVFQQLKESNKIVKLPEIYWKIRKHFYTNLSLQQITSLALFAQNIKKENIVLENLPGDYFNYMGISYWKPDYEKTKKLVKDLLNYDIEIDLQMPDKYKITNTIIAKKKKTTLKISPSVQKSEVLNNSSKTASEPSAEDKNLDKGKNTMNKTDNQANSTTTTEGLLPPLNNNTGEGSANTSTEKKEQSPNNSVSSDLNTNNIQSDNTSSDVYNSNR